MTESIETLIQPDGERIAYHASLGNGPGIIYLNGFMSDMQGTKAVALENYAQGKSYPFVRFDYFGHGESSGDFKKGTIGRWLNDALAVIDQLTQGPQLLVGSSMGGWLMLLAALKRPDRIKGVVGIATGADFTEEMILARATADMHQAWDKDGFITSSTDGPEPFTYIVTKELLQEAKAHLLLKNSICYQGYVHLIHGMKDQDVPYQNSLRIAELVSSTDVNVTLVKNGGHRLSAPHEIQLIIDALEAVRGRVVEQID